MALSGERLVAAQSRDAKNATAGSTSSASYITNLPTAGTCGIDFVAPSSGKVTIHFHTAGFNSGANDNKTAVRVGTGAVIGAGSEHYAATDDDMILFTGAATYGLSSFAHVGNLVAGNTYNACMAHKCGGTATFVFRSIKVVPDP
jgi:hypothetical protein